MPPAPIIVVEDHADSRDMLAQILQIWGYAVVTAGNGSELVALLDGGVHPRLVLLDLMMPEISGWEIIERLHADVRLREIPVVVITAVAASVLRRQPIDADAVLTKPFDYDDLQAVVRRFAGDA